MKAQSHTSKCSLARLLRRKDKAQRFVVSQWQVEFSSHGGRVRSRPLWEGVWCKKALDHDATLLSAPSGKKVTDQDTHEGALHQHNRARVRTRTSACLTSAHTLVFHFFTFSRFHVLTFSIRFACEIGFQPLPTYTGTAFAR